jgi:pimeloyl-ACP methyl ester carboxylesterase
MKIIREEQAVGSPHYRDATVKITYGSARDGTEDWAMLEPGTGTTWVIVLHGHGSHGDQLFTRPDLANERLPSIRAKGLGILSPNLRGNAWMCKAAIADLHDLIGYVRSRYQVKRFIIASGSMGGTGALIYAVNHPEDLAGACALCPATDVARYHAFARKHGDALPVLNEIATAIEKAYGGTPETAGANYRANSVVDQAAKLDMPVYLCHGDNDVIIPVEESRTLVAALTKLGRNPLYVEIPGGHHDSPIPELTQGIDWLLKMGH